MLFLSFAIIIAAFLTKILGSEYSTWQIVLFSAIGFIVSYIGMIWVLGWEVSKKALLLYIPQAALFVGAEILFWFMYFSIGFDRFSEDLLLFSVLVVFFFCNYGVFLMANVFTISSFRQIPLEQVAKTTSYVLSIFLVYLTTFSVYAFEFPLYITVGLLAFFYILIISLHSIHLGLPDQFFKKFIVVGWWAMLVVTVAFSFVASKHELLALIPALVMYIAVDLVILPNTRRLPFTAIASYIFLCILAVLANFFL